MRVKVQVPYKDSRGKLRWSKELFVEGSTPMEVLERAAKTQDEELHSLLASATALADEVTVFVNDKPVKTRDSLIKRLQKGDVISIMRSSSGDTQMKRRVYLSIPKDRVGEPLLFQVGHDFDIVTNIRGASISDEIGLVALELTGEKNELDKAIDWLVEKGVQIEQSGDSES